MKKVITQFRFWAVIQFCVTLGVLVAYWYPRAADIIAHPTHVDAKFVYTWSFQILVFGIFWFLPMLVALGVLLLLERFLIGLASRRRKLNGQGVA